MSHVGLHPQLHVLLLNWLTLDRSVEIVLLEVCIAETGLSGVQNLLACRACRTSHPASGLVLHLCCIHVEAVFIRQH